MLALKDRPIFQFFIRIDSTTIFSPSIYKLQTLYSLLYKLQYLSFTSSRILLINTWMSLMKYGIITSWPTFIILQKCRQSPAYFYFVNIYSYYYCYHRNFEYFAMILSYLQLRMLLVRLNDWTVSWSNSAFTVSIMASASLCCNGGVLEILFANIRYCPYLFLFQDMRDKR